MSTTVAISGNTYPVRDQLRALGGRWDPDAKAWRVPANKAGEAKAILASVPAKASGECRRYHHKCADCGARTQGYYRCRSCNLERREGGSRYANGQSYYTRDGHFVLGDDD